MPVKLSPVHRHGGNDLHATQGPVQCADYAESTGRCTGLVDGDTDGSTAGSSGGCWCPSDWSMSGISWSMSGISSSA